MGKEKNKVVGTDGEAIAEGFLKKKKYKILDKNYRAIVGEIDIIAQKGKMIVFVEVKRRETLAYGRPSEAVNNQKQYKIKRSAEEYLMRKKLQGSPIRFDVIEILGEEISHIENAF